MDFLLEHWHLHQNGPILLSFDDAHTITAQHWYHCQFTDHGLRDWLSQNGVAPYIIDSTLAVNTRPHFEQYDDEHFLLILRGVNLNTHADPSDMLSIRLLFFRGALITISKVPSKSILTLQNELLSSKAQIHLFNLIFMIIEGLNRHIDSYLSALEDKITQFDEEIELSDELMETHKALIKMKRFIKPQYYALLDFQESSLPTVHHNNLRLRHSINTITRINENLDFYLSELEIIKGELRQYHAEKMNQNTYLFSVIAAIFLPTTFLTGLLGVNIGGIPGTESPIAFGFFCSLLLAIFALEVWILRRLRFYPK